MFINGQSVCVVGQLEFDSSPQKPKHLHINLYLPTIFTHFLDSDHSLVVQFALSKH